MSQKDIAQQTLADAQKALGAHPTTLEASLVARTIANRHRQKEISEPVAIETLTALAEQNPQFRATLWQSVVMHAAISSRLQRTAYVHWRAAQFEKAPDSSRAVYAKNLRDAIVRSPMSRTDKQKELARLKKENPLLDFEASPMACLLGGLRSSFASLFCSQSLSEAHKQFSAQTYL